LNDSGKIKKDRRRPIKIGNPSNIGLNPPNLSKDVKVSRINTRVKNTRAKLNPFFTFIH
jgi:hypothetical protein